MNALSFLFWFEAGKQVRMDFVLCVLIKICSGSGAAVQHFSDMTRKHKDLTHHITKKKSPV